MDKKNHHDNEIYIKKDWFITKKEGSIDEYYLTTSKKVIFYQLSIFNIIHFIRLTSHIN